MINETVRQIEEMETQSSSIAAVKAANALRELTDRECHTVEDFLRVVERNSSALQRANRSHAPLYTTQQRIVTDLKDADLDSVSEAKERLLDTIEAVVTEIETSKDRAAERAATLIDDGDVLVTHENSSTVMATLKTALDDGKEFHLYAGESRPHFLGRRTARQLADRDGADVTLIVDGAAGHYLSEADRVFVGMNCLIDDVVYNRIGTLPLAATANELDVPVTVVGTSSKFIGSGFTFRNTFRQGSDVMLEPPEGFDIGNPGYDATPTRLLDTVVTEDGILQF
ncbi:translation initiation factor eIF-2B [Haloarcula rubripromontorii]|uniref:Initiation factor 2B n=1 Tax=Haloarcula rubripromontorii TaxID=1705562 RepID=A0A0N0U9J1_9EURY|nr:translation initiation factor eIF-2B [Haloarcula rubripromontorii]KOX93684.1 initiation factor 2B [Haloarcula rubripromontorii]NLV05579.1 translation initiation factor eIF-2B [Haloarcula rubripromontorii]